MYSGFMNVQAENIRVVRTINKVTNQFVYYFKVTNKKEDGQIFYRMMLIKFKHGVELPDKENYININKAFISFYTTKEGVDQFFLKVIDFELLDKNNLKSTMPLEHKFKPYYDELNSKENQLNPVQTTNYMGNGNVILPF